MAAADSPPTPQNPDQSWLRLRRLAIDTYQEPVVYMRADCYVCTSEGFVAPSRVMVTCNGRSIIATLNTVRSTLLHHDEASLSEVAWTTLEAHEGDIIHVSHAPALDSFSAVRAKVFGHELDGPALRAIVRDIASGYYSGLEIAAFLTACAGNRLNLRETVALTQAMVDLGAHLDWGATPVMDKHCVGGLPGNRTTLLVVPIVAAFGLTIPKTSSRAITSPAGTADTMETLAPVDLDLPRMRKVVAAEGGCVAWGGSVSLSPADDIMIRIERPLDLDSEGQLVASVISKKVAAGSSHVVIDIPVGPTAKVRTKEAAAVLKMQLEYVGQELGLNTRVVVTDGTQPVGRGIGPALEAHDVLAILQNHPDGPKDLRERSLYLAGNILELSGRVAGGKGIDIARKILVDGDAWRKFQKICDAQGGMRQPPVAAYRHVVPAPATGMVTSIDNRRLSRIAKLAGAPTAPAAGLQLHARIGDRVCAGEPLYTVHAESQGELRYALEYLAPRSPAVIIGSPT